MVSEVQENALALIKEDFVRKCIESIPINELGSVLKEFEAHRMFPLAYRRMAESSRVFKECDIGKDRRDFYDRRVACYLEALRLFAEFAVKNNLRFVVFKGMPLSSLIYGDVFARQANDIDVLVTDDDLPKADFVARSAGFIQPINHVVSFETQHELTDSSYYFKRHRDDIQLSPYYAFAGGFSIKMEIHSSLRIGGAGNSAEEFYWQTQGVDVGGMLLKSFDPERSFLLLVSNAYENSETIYSNQSKDKVVLRDYADLHYCLKRYEDRLDWSAIKESIVRNDCVTKVAQVLNSLYELYENDANFLMEALSIKREPSIWASPFVERAFSREKRRLATDDANHRMIFSPEEVTADLVLGSVEYLFENHLQGNARVAVRFELGSLDHRPCIDLIWMLGLAFTEEQTLVFQVSFYVEGSTVPTLRFEFNTFYDQEKWYTYCSKKDKIGFGASRQACGFKVPTRCCNGEDGIQVTFSIPLSLLGLSECFTDGQVRVVPGLYKNNIDDEYYLAFCEKPCIFSLCHPQEWE